MADRSAPPTRVTTADGVDISGANASGSTGSVPEGRMTSLPALPSLVLPSLIARCTLTLSSGWPFLYSGSPPGSGDPSRTCHELATTGVETHIRNAQNGIVKRTVPAMLTRS